MRYVLLAAACFLVGCRSSPKPDLGRLYTRSAQSGELDRNPVIVIPGILGSRLVDEDSGRLAWGAFTGDYANPETAAGARIVALPMAEGVPLAELRDDVTPDGVLDDLHISLVGLPISLSAYRNILATLGVGGYRDEGLGRAGSVDYGNDHFTCFQFAYDWRRDNVESARLLHEFILEKEQYVRDELLERGVTPPERIRFDIVAHSMGGLIARYYARYGAADLTEDGSLPKLTWAGAEHVERIVMVGTPNAGSAKAFFNLIDGASFAPILPSYDPAVLGTMPAMYQLIPRERFGIIVDAKRDGPVTGLYEVEFWQRLGWGLGDPDDAVLQRILPDVDDASTRRRIAVDHLAKCLQRAKRFHAAIDRPADPPGDLELHLFAGDAQETPAVVGVDMTSGAVSVRETAPGDGTVTRASALLDERLDGDWQNRLRTPIRWSSVRFLFTDHLGMTKDPMFTDNVLFLLLEAPD